MITLLSVASALLFSLVVLIKLGVPIIIALFFAVLAGYVWWLYERKEDEDRGVIDYLVALMDARDILKYINKLF